MVNLDEPPFFVVGTDVSAKYKGAFCEAKIQKISKTVKCKVQYANGITTFVLDNAVKGQLKVGATVYLNCGNKKKLEQAKIIKIYDLSQYTVVFNDGDTKCLKRRSLCLKSGKHFSNCATLNQFPLTHPEHIGVTPVRTTFSQVQRNRKHKISSGESGKEEASAIKENNFGKVVCVKANDKKKVKDNWFPGLIVAPTSQTSIRTNVAEDYLVRSFKDGKYYTTPKKEITEFTKEIGARVENPTLKTAVEKALFFLDKDELPPHWHRDLLFGINRICVAPDRKVFDNNNSDEESIEEKDHFVAQLFKFMDDRGTPLNQAPVINEKDVDLYKLFKVVNNCGGSNKVNKGKLWKFVANKAGHEQKSFFSVKHCYQQYLHSFEDFYRKLGCTMLSQPRGVRSRSKFSRSIIRNIDKTLPSTSSATDKNKCSRNELNDKKNKDSAVTKKTAKAIKAEEKLLKNNEETSKKVDKKNEDIANNTSHNKQSVKWDPEITETKDPVRNSKTKKEMKVILKKEIKKEIDSDTVDDDQIIEEKKKYTRNLFGKSVRKTTKKEKVVKVKSENTGLPGMRKIRGIKEQIKTVVKDLTPFKKSKRGVSNTQQDASNKGKSDEEVPKLTRSKTKEDLPTNSRRVSVLSDMADSSSIVQLTQPRVLVENLIKIEKEEGSEKKKTLRKKKDEEKAASNNKIPTPIIENVPFDKNSPVIVGDNLVVYYGDKQATTYDAKVINVCEIEGVMKYYVHYKGWNSRYDEWIDVMRIAYKTKDPEPGPEVDNDADFSKSYPPEQKNVDPKKVTSTTNKTKRSVTPLPTNSNIKKSPFSSARPTRSCTLTDRPLFDIGNSDSDEEYTAIVGPSKQYSEKKVFEPSVIIKTEPLDTDTQKKTLYPKTYPSREVLMHRSALTKPKSFMFNVHSIKSEEVDVCEPLEPTYDFNFCRSIRQDSPKLFDFEKPHELPKVVYFPAREELLQQNGSMIPFVPNGNSFYSSDNNVKIIDDPTIKYDVLCMKSPPAPINIFTTPEQSELDGMIVEEDDDDESKLVIAENDNIETDYQMDSDLVISEEHNSSNGQFVKNIEVKSLPPLALSIHTNIELDCKSSSQVKKYISTPKDTDDESTTSCNESIQTALIQSFQMYTNFENHLSQNGLNMDNNDDSTKSGFDSNSKLPTIKNKEIIETATKLINEPLNNKPKKCDFKVQNCKDIYEKEKNMVLPELQCREEILDEDTLNKALVIEYSCKAAEYDIHKPSTSKGFFDSIHQPCTIKDSFYETNTIYDGKNSFFASNSLPSTSKSFYNPESDVSSVLFCEETIPGSPTGTLDEPYDQEQRKKALQAVYEERAAASTMYATNQSFCRPMITSMGTTEEKMEEYTDIPQKDGAILDQQHLQFLAEISGRNLGINVNEPSVTEPLEREPETIVERSFSVTPSRDIMQPPIVDGKPLFVFTPEMNRQERQELIVYWMNILREKYATLLAAKDKVDKNKKKRKKRKRKMAKAAKVAAMDPSQAANGPSTSK